MTFIQPIAQTPIIKPRDDLYTVLRRLGFNDSLRMCMDFGSELCYSGSGQDLLDLTVNDTDYWLGLTSSSEAQDPTFVGTAGRRSSSDYMQISSGGSFTAKAHSSWADALNASGSKFSVLGILRPVLSGTTNASFFTTASQGSGTSRGVQVVYGQAAADLQVRVIVGNGTAVSVYNSGNNLTQNAINFVMVTVELTTSGTICIYKNGSTLVTNANFNGGTVPLTYDGTAPTATSEICDGDSGDFWYGLAVWDKIITDAEYKAMWAALRGKYSL